MAQVKEDKCRCSNVELGSQPQDPPVPHENAKRKFACRSCPNAPVAYVVTDMKLYQAGRLAACGGRKRRERGFRILYVKPMTCRSRSFGRTGRHRANKIRCSLPLHEPVTTKAAAAGHDRCIITTSPLIALKRDESP